MRLVPAFLGLVVWLGSAAQAHDSRPLVISIEEQAPQLYAVQLRVPPTVEARNHPLVSLPDDCLAVVTDGPHQRAGGARFRCDEALGGREVGVRFPAFNPSLSIMLRISWPSGETRSVIVPPGEPVIAIPDPETPAGVAGQYFRLGVEHILIGYDHLLFLACLLVIAGTFRRVVLTVTGFTLAHSVTLGLAALDVVRLPVPPVEAVIALSIVFLATEIARPRRDTLTWRYPILVSSAFGLVHGFGFAAVLGEIGMPQTEVPLALLFFNLGVEAGQLAFIAVLMPLIALAIWALGRGDQTADVIARAGRPVAYVVGITASYWMIERIWGFAA